MHLSKHVHQLDANNELSDHDLVAGKKVLMMDKVNAPVDSTTPKPAKKQKR